MTRALTPTEKANLRKSGHRSDLYLGILAPVAIFKARVNQSFAAAESHDMVAQVTYDTVTLGAYTDIEDNWTVWVGSAEGLADVGMARVRKTPTSTVLYLNEMSEIDWDDNLYLTVVSEVQICARHLTTPDGIVRMDYDIEYDDQNTNNNPVAILGADQVLLLTGATVNSDFDSSNSFCLSGSVASQVWTSPEAASITDPTTTTPVFVFDAAQPQGATVKCVLTSDAGKTTASYRNVWVFDDDNPPFTDFELLSITGDRDTGGWEFSIRMSDQAAQSLIRDRAKVVLFARDYIGATEISVGTEAGRENILAVGWIAGESITGDLVDGGFVEFTCYGPHHWLGQIATFPAGVRDTTATAAKWTEFDNLTVDRGLFNLIYWRSTLNFACDWYKSGDTRRATAIESTAQNLWGQIVEMANETILAQPACDRFGRLYTQVPVNYTPPADRAAIPTVMDVQPQDTVRPVVFDRVILRETAQVASSGVYATPTIVKTYYSLSPGHVPGKYGSRQSYERLLLSTQAQSNTLCGLLSATLNNEYPSIPVTFAGTYRVFDIAPVQIADLEILATDNPRGVGFDGDAIPKNISYVMEGNNYLSVTVDFAAQVDPDLSADGEGESENNWPPIPPLPIPIPPNPIPPLPPVDPTLPAYIFVREGATGIWMYSQFTGEWTNVTESLDPVERALIGQFNPGQYGMAIQRFSTGGGLYCVTNTKVFRGDTTYGFRIMYNTGALYDFLGVNAFWRNIAVSPFTGKVMAIGAAGPGTGGPHTSFYGQFNGFFSVNSFDSAANVSNLGSPGFSASGMFSTRVTLFAGAGFHLAHSSDAGVTWARKTLPLDGFVVRGGGYSKYMLVSNNPGSATTPYYSDDDGDTWTALPVGSPYNVGNQEDYFGMTADGQKIMSGSFSGSVRFSSDAGQNWSALAYSFPAHGVQSVHNFGATHWIACMINVRDVGSKAVIFVTNDDGATFTDISGTLCDQVEALTGGGRTSIVQCAIMVGPNVP
jgi:hypothetical protein